MSYLFKVFPGVERDLFQGYVGYFCIMVAKSHHTSNRTSKLTSF